MDAAPPDTQPSETVPADPIAAHNEAATNPDAPSEVVASETSGQHRFVYAGNGDSLGSLNAVLNRMQAEAMKAKRPMRVLGIRRVWEIKVVEPKASEPDPVAEKVQELKGLLGLPEQP
jgi:hypothetical protein